MTTPLVSFPINTTLDEIWDINLDDILGPSDIIMSPSPSPSPSPCTATTSVCETLFSVIDICAITRAA
jgi:hypothetical protein